MSYNIGENIILIKKEISYYVESKMKIILRHIKVINLHLTQRKKQISFERINCNTYFIVHFLCIIFLCVNAKADDTINLEALGARLNGSAIADDEKIISEAYRTNEYRKSIQIPPGKWPDKNFIPQNTGNTKFVDVMGFVQNNPGFNIDNLGYSIPNYGFGITSMVRANANNDGSDLSFNRIDKSDRSYNSVVSFNYINDGKNSNSQDAPFSFRSVSTKNSSGYTDNIVTTLNSMGNNYWGNFDVNKWSHTGVFGTNWVWDNIQEMDQFANFSCPDSTIDSTLCTARYLNELDFSGIGYEDSKSYYDPTKSTRKIYWITAGHGLDDTNDMWAAWKPDTQYIKYQIITVSNPYEHNHKYMFQALPTGYKPGDPTAVAETGNTVPVWDFHIGSTQLDGNITWTCLGPFTFDVGTVFGIGGGNDTESGYNIRIGTVMYEENLQIYNSIFDMSKANFSHDNPVHVFARMQKNMYLDFSADGTAHGKNNHLLGYGSDSSSLNYKVSGKPIFSIGDNGKITISDKISSLNEKVEITNTIQGDKGAIIHDVLSTDTIKITSYIYKSLPSGIIGMQVYCSDCYSISSPHIQNGIPVWYNGQTWTDALGQMVKHKQ